MAKKMSLEEYIESRMTKLASKYKIPKSLEEDIRQEIALAALQAEDTMPENIGKFRNWRRNDVVENAVVKYLRNERLHADRMVAMDAVELSRNAENRECTDEMIRNMRSQLSELLHKFFDSEARYKPGYLQSVNPEVYERYDRFVTIILTTTWEENSEFIHQFCEETGVTYERGRQIYARMLRILRHPFRSRRLRDFLDAFEEIRDLEVELT